MLVVIFLLFQAKYLILGAFLKTITWTATCNAATGQKGTTKNRNRPFSGKKRGWKVQEGR